MEREAVLEKGSRLIDACDPATWPDELRPYVDERAGRFDPDAVDKLWQYRHRAASCIVAERLGPAYTFCLAVVHMLLDRARVGSLDWELLDSVALWIPGIVEDAVMHTLDIAPIVLAALPYDSGAELLQAVRAKLAAQEGEA